jgi:hypothetical protein
MPRLGGKSREILFGSKGDGMGLISGIIFILLGAVLVGIGQRLSEDVATLYSSVRKHVGLIRHRLAFPRRARRSSMRPGVPTQMLAGSDPSLPVSTQVEHVIEQLRQGGVTESEKQRLAAALLQDTTGSLPMSVTEQSQPEPSDSSATAEALTLAVVASSAVKRVGERGVLAIRLAGIVIACLGVVVLLVGIFHP